VHSSTSQRLIDASGRFAAVTSEASPSGFGRFRSAGATCRGPVQYENSASFRLRVVSSESVATNSTLWPAKTALKLVPSTRPMQI
jgi:hypothetical protein